MEFEEFKKFILELNIKIEGVTPESLFQHIDQDQSGRIDFQEFALYYKEITNGQEFLPFFEEYSHGKQFLTLQEFQNFNKEVQKRNDFSILDSIELFMEFSGFSKEDKEVLNNRLKQVHANPNLE
jgi:Ca2+-binding EF-hand superfamily protein